MIQKRGKRWVFFYIGPSFPWLWFDLGFWCHKVQHIFHDLIAVCLPPVFFTEAHCAGQSRPVVVTTETKYHCDKYKLLFQWSSCHWVWSVNPFRFWHETWKSNPVLTDVGFFLLLSSIIFGPGCGRFPSASVKQTDIILYLVTTQAHNHNIKNSGHESEKPLTFTNEQMSRFSPQQHTIPSPVFIHAGFQGGCRVFGIVPLFPLCTG